MGNCAYECANEQDVWKNKSHRAEKCFVSITWPQDLLSLEYNFQREDWVSTGGDLDSESTGRNCSNVMSGLTELRPSWRHFIHWSEKQSKINNIYGSNRLCISLEKVLEVAALHHKSFVRILEKLFDWYQRSVPSGTLQNRRERGGDGQLSFSMLHLAWKFAAWNRK